MIIILTVVIIYVGERRWNEFVVRDQGLAWM
jgi:hypothetical protein